MTCTSCAHENPAGAKFCEECGTALALACGGCGIELRPAVKFCSECGTRVAPNAAGGSPPNPSNPGAQTATGAAVSPGARKTVTIVFADLAGSTALQERLDPESTQRFMDSYYVAMRTAVESHGGTVTQLLGDGVKAVFGIPRVAEDDAIRAVRAAVEMQRAFRELADQQRGAVGSTGLRVAVNTGEVVANEDAEIIGDPVNVAARLQEQGGDGDVVVGDSTARLVEALVTLEPLGSFTLKGRAEAVAAFRVESLERPASAATAAFVGRDEELARITAVYETAIQKPTTALAVLLGSPGLGKSRLIEEFGRRLGESANVIEAYCDEAGTATFAPLADALRERLGIDADASEEASCTAALAAIPADATERERVAGGIAALLAGSPASPEETFFVVRRFFAALASDRPVVLVIDDLQWAEPLLLDLVEHLVQWGSDVPLLVLIGARPELRDKRPTLTTPGSLVADVVTLAGLDAGAAMRLAANVIGAADLPSAVAAKVLASSEGNPLFVGELVRMLVHEGALKREGDRWTTGTALAALEMPPTIHALLAARIARLHPEERIVLERAAVVGRHFSRSAVAELLPHDAPDLDGRLEALLRSELIERDTGWFFGEPVLRFHHVLIRDAAYGQLLKGTRAELHTRFADWAVARAGDSVEHDETIGWHLEQAHQFLRELGPIDAEGRVIGERASTHLAAAGRRALAGDDVPLAASLLGRATDRLDPDDSARAELALDWCEALLAAGDVGTAAGAIDELDRFVGDSDRLRAWHTCFAGQHTVLTAPEGLQATADTVAAAAESLASQDDAAGEAKAHYVYALALQSLGQIGACEAALDRALAAARRVAGDRRRANTVLAIAPLAALWGPSPVTRASGRCLDVVRVLRITQGAPAVEAVALSCQGVLEALRGRTDAARRMIASAREMVEELGITQRLLEVDVFGGLVELLEGDAPAAERSLRAAYLGLRELGLGIDAAQAAQMLARALLAQDKVEEAEALSHESEALAGDDLKASIAWRGVRAEALARRGEHALALEFANQGVEIAATTDALLDHSDARLSLAVALRAAGRDREADAEERRASELLEAKGATLLVERTRTDIAGASLVATPAEEPSAAAPVLRRLVRPNRATAHGAIVANAVAASDINSCMAQFSESFVEIYHPTGSTFGFNAASLERLLRSSNPYHELTPLATLGDSLALSHRNLGASGTVSKSYDVGAFENRMLVVHEVDEQGLARHREVFATDRFDDAISCLYERYAELLPEGVERECAVMTARAMSAWLVAPNDLDRIAAIIAPDFESVDHRPLSTWSGSGAGAWLDHMSALQAVADDIVVTATDVLALEPSALLVHRMHSGTEHVGGGDYERAFIALFATDAQGRLARVEWFDADREAAALARFNELIAAAVQPNTPLRRVPANRATAFCERFGTAVASRDAETIEADTADDFELVHHPTGTGFGKLGVMAQWRSAFRAERWDYRYELLGALGESLALVREVTHVSGLTEPVFESFGEAEIRDVFVAECDGHGRCRRIDVFAPERLGNAIVRTYERHAKLLPEGNERVRATTIAQSIGAVLGPPDFDAWSAAWAPSIEFVDHRILGHGTLRGVGAVREYYQAMFELEDFTIEVDDILRMEPGAYLGRSNTMGTARSGGGEYERPIVQIWLFGSDGLFSRIEYFDAGHEAEAVACFDALVGGGSLEQPVEPFANSASRMNRKLIHSFNTRNWAGVEACAAAEVLFDDRRPLRRITANRDDWLTMLRFLFDVPSAHFSVAPLATRGELLSLHRYEFEGEVAGGGGPLEIDEHLVLYEVDRDGRVIGIVVLDPEDEDAAYAELDARFHAGEAAAHPLTLKLLIAGTHALTTRDWDAFTDTFTSDLVLRDHRLLGWGTLSGATAFVDTQRALTDLAPDTQWRASHIEISDRAMLNATVAFGTRDGGPYELPFLRVSEIDSAGKICEIDLYDDSDWAAARSRFGELSAVSTASQPFANAATRMLDAFVAAWEARDWMRIESLMAPGNRQIDRRELMHLELDESQSLESLRFSWEMSTSFTVEPLATRGDRLGLHRMHQALSGGNVGPSEIEYLALIEVDVRGKSLALVRFGMDDLDAAYAELDARYDAGEAAAHPRTLALLRENQRTRKARDWDAFVSTYAPDFVFNDHRLLGWGTLRGAAEFTRTQQELIALAPDSDPRIDHEIIANRGQFTAGLVLGTRDGGPFEMAFMAVSELDTSGKICRMDGYDFDHVAEARARFAELSAASSESHPFANHATRASGRMSAAWVDKDWDRLAQVFPAVSDRRRGVRLELDRDEAVAFARSLGELDTTGLDDEVVATRGMKLALTRHNISVAGGDVGSSEISYLSLLETDDQGDAMMSVRWDADDLDAAYAELDARYDAGEGASNPSHFAFIRMFREAIATQDWAPVIDACLPTFVEYDHQSLATLGTVHGAEAWVEKFRTLDDLAPGTIYRVPHFRSVAHGYLSAGFWQGARDGGQYEIPAFAVLEEDEQGRLVRADLYDDANIEAAFARLAELAEPVESSHAFANAATRQMDRFIAAWHARDWAGVEARFAPDMRHFDRRDLMQLEMDRSQHLDSIRFNFEMATSQFSVELLATRGDRLLLQRVHLALSDGDVGPSEIEFISLNEVDARGAFVTFIRWNPDDANAAYDELEVRFQAGEAAAHPRALASFLASTRASEAHDWDAFTANLTPDLIVRDHRLLGWGTLNGADAFTRTQEVLVELAPDTQWRADHLAIAEDGVLRSVLAFGTREGGPFELAFVHVNEIDANGKSVSIDLYDVDQSEKALARFADLSDGARASQPVANLATRASARNIAAWVDKDWDRFERLFPANAHLSDRRRAVQLELDRDEAIAFSRSLGEQDTTSNTSEILATRGERLALLRWRIGVSGGDAGPSELVHLNLLETDEHGDLTSTVRWDDDALDAAYAELDARFSAIGSSDGVDPRASIAQRNTAMVMMDRWVAAYEVGFDTDEWDPMRRICSPSITFDDRRSMALLVGGMELMISAASERVAMGARPSFQPIGAAGDRIAVQKLLWSGGPKDGPFEIEYLCVQEVDENELFTAFVLMDLDYPRAAQRETWARWFAIEPEAAAVAAPVGELVDAFNEKDRDTYRAVFADDLVVVDHRIAGMGRIDGADAYIESVVALWEIADDHELQQGWVWPAFDRHGAITVGRRTGTIKDGGAFESEYLSLHLVADGHITHVELFELDALDDALARFETLRPSAKDNAEPKAEPNAGPSIEPNAASKWFAGWEAAFHARDWQEHDALMTGGMGYEDRRRLFQLTGDKALSLASARERAKAGTRSESSLLGTAGDRVAILRVLFSGGPADGRFESEMLTLIEVDEAGLLVGVVHFDLEDTRAAQREAWARWAAIEPWVESVVRPFGDAADAFNEQNRVKTRAVYADDLIVEDHRLVGMGRIDGADAFLASVVALWEIAPDNDIQQGWNWLAFDRHGAVTVVRRTGTVPGGGGDFESEYLVVCLVAQGLGTRVEMFELDALDEALARFAELTEPAPISSYLDNTAARTVDRANSAMGLRDFEGFAATFAPGFRAFDRRALVQLDSARDEWLASYRQIVEMTSSRPSLSVLATRGDRLAICRIRWQGANGDIGQSELKWLSVFEVDERGDQIATVEFDPDDLDAAYAELDARWESGESAAHPQASSWIAEFRRGFAARDWPAMRALSAPDQVAMNHRTVGWGTLEGPGAWVQTLEALVELAPDTRQRIDHIRTCERGFLWAPMWLGTRDGGEFETPQVNVIELDAQGRQIRLDLWDIEQLDLARERFEALASQTPSDPHTAPAAPNAANVALERWTATFDACVDSSNWDAMRALYAPDTTFEDRQSRSLVTGNLETQLASVRERGATGARPAPVLLGTAGDRVAMRRILWSGGPPDGRFEIEHLAVVEVGETGLFTATILFDSDDTRTAQREAWARWAAIDPVAAPFVELISDITDAWNGRDADAIRARFADDVIVEDHRHAGLGRLEGADAYIESNVVLWELAPDQRIEFSGSWPAVERHAALASLRRQGTLPDGGAFENDYLWLCVVRDERITHLELFEIEALDAALARFEELRPDPLRIPPNAATRAIDRLRQMRGSADSNALRATVTDDFYFDDRQRRSLVVGGVEEWLRALDFLWTEARAQLDTVHIATAGDRLVLDQNRWEESPGDGRFEMESLRIAEVDGAGKLRALIFFDLEDRAAAHAELFERYVANGADGMPDASIELKRAVNDHDFDRIRAVLPADFVVHDHRRTGMGLIEGVEAWIESLAAIYELGPDVRTDELHTAAVAPDGRVSVGRMWGRNTEGGEFESNVVWLFLYRAGRVARIEVFEVEDLEAALARFEELRSD